MAWPNTRRRPARTIDRASAAATSPCRRRRARDRRWPRDPANLEALNALGYSLHSQGQAPRCPNRRICKLANLQPVAAIALDECRHRPPLAMSGSMRRCYAFARAAALGADTADFYYNVALAHIARDDYEAARSLLQKALQSRTLTMRKSAIGMPFAATRRCAPTKRSRRSRAGKVCRRSRPMLSANAGHLMMKLGEIEPRRTDRAQCRCCKARPIRAPTLTLDPAARTHQPHRRGAPLLGAAAGPAGRRTPRAMTTQCHRSPAGAARIAARGGGRICSSTSSRAASGEHLRHFQQLPAGQIPGCAWTLRRSVSTS